MFKCFYSQTTSFSRNKTSPVRWLRAKHWNGSFFFRHPQRYLRGQSLANPKPIGVSLGGSMLRQVGGRTSLQSSGGTYRRPHCTETGHDTSAGGGGVPPDRKRSPPRIHWSAGEEEEEGEEQGQGRSAPNEPEGKRTFSAQLSPMLVVVGKGKKIDAKGSFWGVGVFSLV